MAGTEAEARGAVARPVLMGLVEAVAAAGWGTATEVEEEVKGAGETEASEAEAVSGAQARVAAEMVEAVQGMVEVTGAERDTPLLWEDIPSRVRRWPLLRRMRDSLHTLRSRCTGRDLPLQPERNFLRFLLP